MDTKEQLAEYAAWVQQGLEEYLAPQPGLVGHVIDSARYSALAGGKRLRPALLMEFYRLCGGEPRQALPFACALEMIHTYSLIHDDLPCMDNDDLRRGKPTNHKVYGEAIALLAGDGLLTCAFETMLRPDTPAIQPQWALEAAGIFASCAGMGGMIGGQVMDLAFEERVPGEDELQHMVALKTGCLLRAACVAGCALAGERGPIRQCAEEYAKALGLAFQIQDDILDVTGRQEKLGKPIGSDAQNHKNTFVRLYGLAACQRRVAELTSQAVASVAPVAGSGFLQQLAQDLACRDH